MMVMTTATDVRNILTIGELAEILDQRAHRVRYVIQKLDLRPVRRIANAFVWPADVVGLLRDELERLDARRAAIAAAT